MPKARGVVFVRARERQRWHTVDGLFADAERLTARRHEVDSRTPSQDGICHLGAVIDQVLAVVEHDEDVLGRKGVKQGP